MVAPGGEFLVVGVADPPDQPGVPLPVPGGQFRRMCAQHGGAQRAVAARRVGHHLPHALVVEQCRTGRHAGGPYIGVLVGKPVRVGEQRRRARGGQPGRRQPHHFLAAGHLAGAGRHVRGQQLLQPGRPYEEGGPARRVDRDTGAVVPGVRQQAGQHLGRAVGTGEGGERRLGEHDGGRTGPGAQGIGADPRQTGQLLDGRRPGPQRQSLVPGGPFQVPRGRPVLTRHPADRVGAHGYGPGGGAPEEPSPGRCLPEEAVEQIGTASGEHPLHGGQGRRRGVAVQDAFDTLVLVRGRLQPQPDGGAGAGVVAVQDGLPEQFLEAGHGGGAASDGPGEGQDEPVVRPFGPRFQPGPQGLEHGVLLASAQGPVEPAEIGAAAVPGDPDQGAQGPVEQGALPGDRVFAQDRHGEGAERRPGRRRGVTGLHRVGGDPVQQRFHGVRAERGRGGEQGAQRGGADRVLFVAQPEHVVEDGGDGGQVGGAARVAYEQRPAFGAVVGGGRAGRGQQPFAYLRDRQIRLGEQHRVPVGAPVPGPRGHPAGHGRHMAPGQHVQQRGVDGPGRPLAPAAEDLFAERAAAARRQGQDQPGEQIPGVRRGPAEFDEERVGDRPGEAAQQDPAEHSARGQREPVGSEEQPYEPDRVGGEEPAEPAAHRECGGPVELQEAEDPVREVRRGGGHPAVVAVPLPPCLSPCPGPRRQVAFRGVEEGAGVAGAERAPAAHGAEQSGQQAVHHRGRTAGQQTGGLGVAPGLPQGAYQPVGEAGAAVGDDRPDQMTAYGGRRVVERRLVGGVRYTEAARHPQRHAPDPRIPVGDPRPDPPGVAARGRRDDGEMTLVRIAALQLLQDRPQHPVGGQAPCAHGEFPHPPRIGQGFQGVEESAGQDEGLGVGHGVILPCRTGSPQRFTHRIHKPPRPSGRGPGGHHAASS
ncbi:hypothetical protein [Streptomyces sp. TE33382]